MEMNTVVAVALFIVAFSVTTEAAHHLENGGQILSATGQYIRGKFPSLEEYFHSAKCSLIFIFEIHRHNSATMDSPT